LLNVFVLNPQAFSGSAVVISLFWTLYNAAGLIVAVLICIERPRVRSAERVEVELPVIASIADHRPLPGHIVDLSVAGAKVFLPFTSEFQRDSLTGAPLRPTALEVESVGIIAGHSRWMVANDDGVTLGFSFQSLSTRTWIDLVGVLTDSPTWVRGDREVAARLATSVGRTVAGTATRVIAHARRDVRIPVNSPAHVRPLTLHRFAGDPSNGSGKHRSGSQVPVLVPTTPEPVEALVEDYSFGGARLRTRRQLEPGGFVSVEIPTRLEFPELAEVRWVRRSRRGFHAGVSFARSESQGVTK
jgi:cellulose synthase (UDP-forming)